MSRSITLYIIGTILTLLLISVTEANNSEYSVTQSSLPPGSLVNNERKTDNKEIAKTTIVLRTPRINPCSGNKVFNGFHGCYYAYSPNDSCEFIYGACDCYGDSTCCAQDECLILPTIPTETTTLAHNKCLKK
jgi:hypothetical protein